MSEQLVLCMYALFEIRNKFLLLLREENLFFSDYMSSVHGVSEEATRVLGMQKLVFLGSLSGISEADIVLLFIIGMVELPDRKLMKGYRRVSDELTS